VLIKSFGGEVISVFGNCFGEEVISSLATTSVAG